MILRNINIRHIFLCSILVFTPVATALAASPLLEGIDGKRHLFSEYIGQGKWTVVNIWGPKCPPCREETPDLVQFYDTHHTSDATVVGIAIDFPSYGYAVKQEVADFAEDFMIDYPLLLSDSTITEKLGLGHLEGLPTTYIFTPEGEVIGVQVGAVTKKILEDFLLKHKKPNHKKIEE